MQTSPRVLTLLGLSFAALFVSHPSIAMVFTPSSSSVDSGGAARVSVQIVSPPATFGMKPELQLTYTSGPSSGDIVGPNRTGYIGTRGGNGPVGVGWSISGLSSIERCPQTMATDNVVGAVKLNSSDRFCLDGQRLVSIGTGVYGADGTEYRTESETMTKVISYGTSGSGPAWFKVWTLSGLIKEYGNTTDSRFLATGTTTARSWAESKTSDRKGNYYTVTYLPNTSTGEYLPSRIDYTGNATASLAPYNSIRFTYDARPDVGSYFIGTSQIRFEQRLTNVKTFADSTLVKDYRIAYDAGPGFARSRAISVTECGGDATCLAPLTFSYTAGGGGITQSGGTPQSLGAIAYAGGTVASMVAADFNGDGVQDVWVTSTSGAGRICYGPTFSTNQCSTAWAGAKVHVLDYNGDGIADLALQYPAGNFSFCPGPDPLSHCVAAPSNFSFPQSEWDFVAADVQGIGRDFLIARYIAGGSYSEGGVCDPFRVLTGNGCQSAFVYITNVNPVRGDFDGDGTIDLIFPGTTSNYTCTNSNFASGACATYANSPSWQDSTIVPGDFNGDSKTDVMLLTTAGLKYCAGPGLLAANNCISVTGTSGDWKALYQGIAGDFNADGIIDLMLTSATGTFFCPGPGITAAYNCVQVNSNDWRNAKLAATDFTGDSSADLMVATGSAVQLASGATGRPDLMSTVTNGAFGTATSFVYRPLTDTTVYTKGAGAFYPLQETQQPLHVVSQVTVPNGVGGTNPTNYKYEKGRINLAGRGFGFETTRATDVAGGRETVATWALDFPHLGRVQEVNVYVGGQLAGRNVKALTTWYTFESRPMSAVGSEIDASYGLDGSWASARHTYGYSHYGYFTTVQTYYDELESSMNPPKFKRIVSRIFNDSVADWLFAQPQTENAWYYNAAGNQADFQTRSFTTVPGTQLVQSETREPNIAAVRVVTTYGRDTFGNVTSTTVTGDGMPARVTTTPYDSRGQFPYSTTNPLGHVTSQSTDARFGFVTGFTDANGLTTTWQPDTFGRKILETRPDNTQSTWAYEICCTINSNNPNLAFRIASTVTGSSQPTYSYFDALTRPVLTQRRSFANTGWIDEKNTWYDAKGRVIRSYLPYDQGATNPPYVASTYDTYGRLWKQTTPDGGLITYTYTAQPNAGPITTWVLNSRNFTTRYVRNVHGELIQVIDALNKVTSYEYSPLSKTTKITDGLGNQTTLTYNNYGSTLARNDPDLGAWTFTYDPLGQMVTQTDAKSQVTTFTYDKISRLTQRVEPSLTATWTWDTAVKGIGKVASTSTNGSVTRTYTFDSLSRPSTQTLGVDGSNYSMTSTYDTAGRAETLTYPTGFATKNVYNSVGYLSEVRNNSNNALFWKVVAASPAGITDEDYGNGTGVARNFDPNTQRVSQIGTLRDSDGALLQNLTYGYDLAGNVTARSETTQSVSETFAYDAVNRLTSVTGPASKTYTYDDIGNITSKSDVGTYTYPSSGKVHAVSSVAGVNYSYDPNGNLQSAGNRSFAWTSFNMPATSQIASASYSWLYDAERQRVKYTAPGETTIYFGAGNSIVLEKTIKPTVTEQKHYVYANGKPVALYTQRSVGTSDTRYLYSDHLRSTTLALDEVGGLVERLSYDAHGKRRFPSGSDDSANTLTGIATDRGFTEHEHLDELGIIHMNGRLYDPRVGRFISPDPVIQDAASPQSLNRYAYVLNNPLRYTDPSGYNYCDFISGGCGGCRGGSLCLNHESVLIDQGGFYGWQSVSINGGGTVITGQFAGLDADVTAYMHSFQMCNSCLPGWNNGMYNLFGGFTVSFGREILTAEEHRDRLISGFGGGGAIRSVGSAAARGPGSRLIGRWTPNGPSPQVPVGNRGILNHIFSGDAGHLARTDANIELLNRVVAGEGRYVGVTHYGVNWYTYNLNGQQLLVSTYGNNITNAFINVEGLTWNSITGFSGSIPGPGVWGNLVPQNPMGRGPTQNPIAR